MAGRRTQQGQSLPLVALVVVTLMVAAALSVDVGSVAVTNRRLQGIADLAAIDGARELTGAACDTPVAAAPFRPQKDQVTNAVLDSAQRNGFVPGGDKVLVVALGQLKRADAAGVPFADGVPIFTEQATCTSADFPDAVRVRVTDRTAFSFAAVIGQNGRSTTREAVASRGEALDGEGAFSLGSTLASVDTERSTLLNPILAEMLCQPASCNLSLDAVGYQGLVDSDITFGDLATQLNFGTTSELLAAEVSIDDILSASANLLDASSAAEADAVTALGQLTVAVTGNQKIKLAELVSADLLTGNEAADVGLSLFQLVTGSAAIANGSNLVSIPDLNVTLPAGITNIAVGFSLIEAPVIIGKTVGAVGATRTTKQLSITVTPQINLSSGTLTGLNLTSVTGTLPMTITGGVATGVLTGVRCGADKGIDVNVKPSAANISTSGTLTVSLNSDGTNAGVLKTLGGILTTVVPGQVFTNTITVTGTGVSTAVPAGGYDRSFAYPDEFGPDGSLHVGKTTIGFDNIAYGSSNMTMAVQTLPTLPLLPNVTVNVTAGVTSAGLVTLLQPVLTQLDTKVVQPLMESLGLELGAADIMANSLTCGIPRLG